MPGHRRSVRLASADYTAPGLYFVTVVAAGRAPVFGHLDGDRVRLSDAGHVAHDEWVRTGDLRPGIALDAFVVMPDHVHVMFGIVCAGPDATAGPGTPAVCPYADGCRCADGPNRAICNALADAPPHGTPTAPTRRGTPLVCPRCGIPPPPCIAASHTRTFGGADAGSVAAVMRQYKAVVTKRVGAPVWQRGYHDRIVRTPREAENVRRYIAENPARASAARSASADQNTVTGWKSRR